ncbi:MAG TPA: hypothetical protein VG347_05925 [Verrucomicrobiae bacterium]|nr:hypothetical protein [Verrucomicrobiae bacterium]
MVQSRVRTVLLIAVLALGSSCSHMFMAKWPPAVDPLQGWTGWTEEDPAHPAMSRVAVQPVKHSPLAQTIKNDYQNYLKQHGCDPVDAPLFYEDGTGQHAVKVEVENDQHDIIVYIFTYDKANHRTSTRPFYHSHTSC